MGKDISCVNAWFVPHYDEISADDKYQPGLGAQSHYGTHEPAVAHPDVTRVCLEQLYF